MRIRAAYLLVALMTACGGPAPAGPAPNIDATVQARVQATLAAQPKPVAPTPQPSPVPSVPIVLQGAESKQTEPFILNSGTYRVVWTLTPRQSDGGCVLNGTLEPVEPGRSQSLFNVDGRANQAGETMLYRVQPGRYFVKTSSTCPGWSITITPR